MWSESGRVGGRIRVPKLDIIEANEPPVRAEPQMAVAGLEDGRNGRMGKPAVTGLPDLLHVEVDSPRLDRSA